jgi:hypothetical protein
MFSAKSIPPRHVLGKNCFESLRNKWWRIASQQMMASPRSRHPYLLISLNNYLFIWMLGSCQRVRIEHHPG